MYLSPDINVGKLSISPYIRTLYKSIGVSVCFPFLLRTILRKVPFSLNHLRYSVLDRTLEYLQYICLVQNIPVNKTLISLI